MIDESGYLKLSCSSLASASGMQRDACTSYLAPEVLRHLPQSYPIDLWALGSLIYELMIGTPPFSTSGGGKKTSADKTPFDHIAKILEHADHQNLHNKPSSSSPPQALTFPFFFPKDSADLIKSLLNGQASQRPTARQCLVSHPFLSSIDALALERPDQAAVDTHTEGCLRYVLPEGRR